MISLESTVESHMRFGWVSLEIQGFVGILYLVLSHLRQIEGRDKIQNAKKPSISRHAMVLQPRFTICPFNLGPRSIELRLKVVQSVCGCFSFKLFRGYFIVLAMSVAVVFSFVLQMIIIPKIRTSNYIIPMCTIKPFN